MDLREMGLDFMDRIDPAQDRSQWRALENRVKKPEISKLLGKFLCVWRPVDSQERLSAMKLISRSLGRYSSLAESGHGVFLDCHYLVRFGYSSFLTETLCAPRSSSTRAACTAHLVILVSSCQRISSIRSFLQLILGANVVLSPQFSVLRASVCVFRLT
jgi:hypothetical protein